MEVLQSQHFNTSSSAFSSAGPSSSLAMITPPVLDENGHVQMNRPRRTSLFGARDSQMSRLPADGQAQVESEQSPASQPQSPQQIGMSEGKGAKEGLWGVNDGLVYCGV